jgi:plastocyanin
MKKASVLLVALALALFGLAACGDDDDDEETTAAETATTETAAGGAGGTVALSTAPDAGIAYDQSSLEAAAGSVTIDYDNQSSLSHDVVIEDESGAELGKSDLVSQGTTSVTADLQPGTYTFFCDVPGHREGGMEGTLTVN